MKPADCFHYNFLVIALIALLNCPDRNDYNLPLALLAYLTWNFSQQRSQRHRILWLLLTSLLCDAIWILAISIGQWGNVGSGNKLKGLTQILSLVNFSYKMVLVIWAIIGIEQCQHFFTLSAFKAEFLQLK